MTLNTEQLTLFARLARKKGLKPEQHTENISAHHAADGTDSFSVRVATVGTSDSRMSSQPENKSAAPRIFPMTDIQHAYWLGRTANVNLSGVASHGYQEFDCGPLDMERLRSAWDKVIARHDMLRAIVTDDGMFEVLETVPSAPWEIEDLRTLPQKEKEERLLARREASSHRVPDLSCWPIVTLGASLVSNEHIRLHLSCDATIADIYSMGLAMQELYFFYTSPEGSLPEPAMTFGDYVTELKAREKIDFFQHCRQYWQQRLPALPPAPGLPVLNANPANQRFRRMTGSLSPDEWTKMQELCRRNGLTPSATLFAIFSAVLGQWSHNSRYCINVTLLNRESSRPEVKGIIGDFATTILASARSAGITESFVDYAHELEQELWQCLEHSAYSGIRVLQDLSELLGHVELMPVVFTSTLGAGDLGHLFNAEKAIFDSFSFSIVQTPQVWIDHQIIEENGCLVFNWDVVEGVFREETLQAMFSTYENMVRKMAASHKAWTEQAAPAIPEEQILRRQNLKSTCWQSALLHTAFFVQACAKPHAIAIHLADRSIQYGELAHKACSIAGELLSLLNRKKTGREYCPTDAFAEAEETVLVAVCMAKNWLQPASVLAVLLAGAAYVPVDPYWPKARIRSVLRQGVAAVITEPAHKIVISDAADGLPVFVVQDEEEQKSGAGEWNPFTTDFFSAVKRPDAQCLNYSPKKLAYVIFTSGTTGVPKGVMMTHEAVHNTIMDIRTRFGITDRDCLFALSSLSFDLSVFDIFGILGAGGTLVLPGADEGRDPEAWVSHMNRHAVTIWNTVPALWQMLLEHGSLPEHMPRLALLSGDWIPVSMTELSSRMAPQTKLVSLGGATEAAIWSTLYELRPGDPPPGWKSIPYGRAMTGQTMDVLHENMSLCPDDVTGEIYIGGAGLSAGYIADSALTADKFVHHPVTGERLYRTGDIGRWRTEGQIEFLGRKDNQVKINGFRIEPGDIETALCQLPGISLAVVGVRTLCGTSTERSLVAHVLATSPDAKPQAAEVQQALREVLPAYMVPQHIIVLDTMPLSDNGKVDRKALPVPENCIRELRAPGTELEEQLHQLLATHLGFSTFGLDDRFFDLGVTSLMMVRLQRDINAVIGKKIGLVHLFEAPTIRSLASFISKHFPSADSNRLPTDTSQEAAKMQSSGQMYAEKRLARRAKSRPSKNAKEFSDV